MLNDENPLTINTYFACDTSRIFIVNFIYINIKTLDLCYGCVLVSTVDPKKVL